MRSAMFLATLLVIRQEAPGKPERNADTKLFLQVSDLANVPCAILTHAEDTVSRIFRDARMMSIGEGANESLLPAIGRSVRLKDVLHQFLRTVFGAGHPAGVSTSAHAAAVISFADGLISISATTTSMPIHGITTAAGFR